MLLLGGGWRNESPSKPTTILDKAAATAALVLYGGVEWIRVKIFRGYPNMSPAEWEERKRKNL